MAQRTVLVCDRCGSESGVFQFHLRAMGAKAPDYRGDLCLDCYKDVAAEAGASRGKPRRSLRQGIVAVDYDTGMPL